MNSTVRRPMLVRACRMSCAVTVLLICRRELVELILHQRDERRDHDRHSWFDQGWDLVAQRFAGAGRHDGERMAAVEHGVDHGALSDSQLADAEGFLEERG
jgi:hypothetical protein